MGSASAAITTNSQMPLLRVLVAAGTGEWRVSDMPGDLIARSAVASNPYAFTFVGTPLELLIVGGLLDDVQDGVGELQGRPVCYVSRCFRGCTSTLVLQARRAARTWASASGYAFGFTASAIATDQPADHDPGSMEGWESWALCCRHVCEVLERQPCKRSGVLAFQRRHVLLALQLSQLTRRRHLSLCSQCAPSMTATCYRRAQCVCPWPGRS